MRLALILLFLSFPAHAQSIIEFKTEEAAQTCSSALDALAAVWWPTKGYTVSPDAKSPSGYGVVGKNAKTGEDEPGKQKTLTWSPVYQSPVDTYYVVSLSNDMRFYNPPNLNWKLLVPDSPCFLGTEKEYPEEWKQETGE